MAEETIEYTKKTSDLLEENWQYFLAWYQTIYDSELGNEQHCAGLLIQSESVL